LRTLIFSIILGLGTCSVKAQKQELKPLQISLKLSLMPYPPGASAELYYHINSQMAVGVETNIFATEPDISNPSDGGFIDLNLPYEGYSEETRSYLLKYQYLVKSEEFTYYQFAFTGGIGISHYRKVVGYTSSSSGSIISFTSYDEVNETKTAPTGQLGIHVFKRKRPVGFLIGIDLQFSEHQFIPLIKTGLQINIFNKGTKYHGGYS